MLDKIPHIAVIRLSAMGDVAMTVPVLRAFVKQYPNVKITVISRPFFQPFFENIPGISFFAFDEIHRHKGILGLFRLFQDLKPLNIDAFADLHNIIRSKIIRFFFACSGKKISFTDKGREDKKALIRPINKVFVPLLSVFERHANVFEQLGFPVDLSNPSFPEKAILDESIIALIGDQTSKLIGIAPFAQYDSKVYPLDLMEEVIIHLSKIETLKIVLFGGGEKEIEWLNTISSKNKNVINIAGKVQFKQELDLISNLDVMLSMDSGNGHIAAMLGVKVISLWGATHPFLGFSPFNQPVENAIVSDNKKFPKLPTSIYGNKIVAGYEEVMRTILPETVINKIKSTLFF